MMINKSGFTIEKYLERNVPNISIAEIEPIVRQIYGVEGKFFPLSSERDLNFRIQTNSGRTVVFKIANQFEDSSVIEFQIGALEHLRMAEPDLLIPHVVRSQEGETVSQFTTAASIPHFCYMLTYLQGQIGREMVPPSGYWRQLGTIMARLDQALRSYFHPSARHDLLWDMTRSPDLRPYTTEISTKESRQTVEKILNHFADQIKPNLHQLRHQVIHNDAHRGNVLVRPQRPSEIAGLLDFGDILYAPLLTELAVALDFKELDENQYLEALAALVGQYNMILPLEEIEVELLYDFVLTRQAMVVSIANWRNKYVPDESTYSVGQENERVIENLLALGRQKLIDTLRRACGFPSKFVTSDLDVQREQSGALFEQRQQFLGRHLKHFYNAPLHITHAKGAWMFGADGRAYLDAYNNVPVVGHGHPKVVQAIRHQLSVLNTNTRYLYRPIVEYGERLAATLTHGLSACLFVNSGSEANDVAWQIAQFVSGNSGAIVMENAYHGITDAVKALSPAPPKRPLQPHVQMIRTPDATDAERAIEDLSRLDYAPACFMVDTTLLSNGLPAVPEDYFVDVASQVRQAGGVIVADEVQAGFGRLGTQWGYSAHNLAPDIVTLGKPVGNGYPLGVVITRPEILNSFIKNVGLFSTFGGNPVAAAAGLAVLDIIEEDELITQATQAGEHLRKELAKLQLTYPQIEGIRGQGSLTGVAFKSAEDDAEFGVTAAQVHQVVEQMRENGVLLGVAGPEGLVLKIRPSLVFDVANSDRLAAALDQSLKRLF